MAGNILEHQQTAGVIKMMFGSMVTMLPYLSYGCIQSYFTTGLPKLMKPNQTGILLDLHQMSWISKSLVPFKQYIIMTLCSAIFILKI